MLQFCLLLCFLCVDQFGCNRAFTLQHSGDYAFWLPACLLTCIGMLELLNRIKLIMTCNLSSDNIWQNDPLCRDESAFGGIRISRWIAHYWSGSDDWGLGDTQQALYLNSPADPNCAKFDQFRSLNWIRYMCTRNQWPGTSLIWWIAQPSSLIYNSEDN